MTRERQQPEQELIRNILAGDTEKFRFIIQRYEAPLRRYLRRITNEREETLDDFLQEIFMKAYENLASVDERISLSAWLYRIARNHAISKYRKKRTREGEQGHLFLEHGDLERIAQTGESREEEFLKLEEAKELGRAFETLKEREREVIILRYFEGRSYTDIADILQVPTGTVSTLISRAKKKLKRVLTKERL